MIELLLGLFSLEKYDQAYKKILRLMYNQDSKRYEKKQMLIPPELFIIHNAPDYELDIFENADHDDVLVEKIESDFHSIQIIQNNIGKFLLFDKTYQAGFIETQQYSGNLPYINYFLLPYLACPNINNILLIGMGSGKIINDYEKIAPNLKKIDIVDIDPNIFEIAQKHFGFEKTNKTNLHIQDGRVFLRETKTKYDVIIIDIAGNEGIPFRYMSEEFLFEAKEKLSDEGILVTNMFSSADLENPKNHILKSLYKTYNNVFNNLTLFRCDYSDKIFYKTFFDYDKRIIDVTNALFFASKKNDFSALKSKPDQKTVDTFKNINIQDLEPYLKDQKEIYFQANNTKSLKDSFLSDPEFCVENFNNYVNLDK